ncbi:hypothetical protein MIMGU_mgv1a001944mg [Erythranthe guttata]|uniref:RNA uridylyltransferase n=1 Tax=Erythranthe guttata TaxID=4155 RepID=A0A022QXH4_ERYGU|nr:PREDICTED: uncharacterized protein LOC105963736 [Erythranthe guttata]EYU32028.1 hypothetical protein MIMGU_mgv1a001944mg [Erythranthe guttata]|eukprot:XP_012843633.1 PREDICTED: uncharacterized protein LOC105963736 [Erythranthe guttata]
MNARGGDAPPASGGDFLLQLLRNPPNFSHLTPPSQQQTPDIFSQDPAVAAVGPTVPTFPLPQGGFPSNGTDLQFRQWKHSPVPPFAPHQYFQQNPIARPNLNPDFPSPPPPGELNYAPHQFNLQSNRISPGEDARKLAPYGDNSRPSAAAHQQLQSNRIPLGEDARRLGVFGEIATPSVAQHQREQNHLIFGSLNRDILQTDAGDVLHQSLHPMDKLGNSYLEEVLGMDRRMNRFPVNEVNGNSRGNSSGNERRNQGDNGSHRALAPPGFSSNNMKNVGNREHGYVTRNPDNYVDKGKGNSGGSYKNGGVSNPINSPGSMMGIHVEDGGKGKELRFGGQNNKNQGDRAQSKMNGIEDQMGSLGIEEESGETSDKKKNPHDKEYRSDQRGQWIMGQRMRHVKMQTACRKDIDRFNSQFLTVFESLIPADEERVKQKQLLTVLEKLVAKEWPDARLYLYGSCANSFGFSKSDLDVCLAIELGNNEKSEVVLKLADILQSDNLQNVQALTRARVPVVKLMDPVTGISCDICVNNMLAVVNTKLLYDYARIDVRLRQLAFIVKHWAKSRGVNETYQGTLSSYAYVLMCIHFLQQRRPAILPCLQAMNITYFRNVDNVECAYFDQVEKLGNFGSRNGESIAHLVWAFFHYWAYCHDYATDVVSVRTGSTLSKRTKDWTRRVGNDRHLICIEDPFEVSHDLGRVVDKYSIRVLREEFERAAEIMQYDPNPCVTLFHPYVPN